MQRHHYRVEIRERTKHDRMLKAGTITVFHHSQAERLRLLIEGNPERFEPSKTEFHARVFARVFVPGIGSIDFDPNDRDDIIREIQIAFEMVDHDIRIKD